MVAASVSYHQEFSIQGLRPFPILDHGILVNKLTFNGNLNFLKFFTKYFHLSHKGFLAWNGVRVRGV